MEHSDQELLDIFFTKGTAKTGNEVSAFMKLLFTSPRMLMSKVSQLKSEQPAESESGLDVKMIFKLYESIEFHKKEEELALLYTKSFDELWGAADIKEHLKSAEDTKYFLVVALWEGLFTRPAHRNLLHRVLQVIQKGNYYQQVFTGFLKDLPGDYLRKILPALHENIQAICTRLVEEEQSEEGNRRLGVLCDAVCHFMQCLYDSNKEKPRVHIGQFNSGFLTKFFEPVQQFKIYLRKSSEFNFIRYPFLLDFNYKYQVMQIESIYEQKMNIKKNMQTGLSSIIDSINFSGNFSIEGLIYLYLSVHRNNILDDSMEKLGKVKGNLKSPLRIQFIGEEGADEGGVKNEYFALLTKAIFNPYLDMFLPRNDQRYYWFNGFSYQIPLRFEFVGMLLGLALYNSVHLDIHFPEIAYKKLLNPKYEEDYGLEIIEDLREIYPDEYRTLKDILSTTENVEDIELYFNIELESFGEKVVEELVEEGHQTKVTNDNRDYYCLLYADYLLNKHIQKQFIPFRRGFYRVVSGGIIETFASVELRDLINGMEEINIKELEETCQYEGGYSPETPVIRYLWQFLHKLTMEEKKSFMTFVTGTDRVPIDGLKSLKFLIQRHSNTSNLPTAHTCFNVLLLPEYESREQLEKNMRLILEHNQGFGLI